MLPSVLDEESQVLRGKKLTKKYSQGRLEVRVVFTYPTLLTSIVEVLVPLLLYTLSHKERTRGSVLLSSIMRASCKEAYSGHHCALPTKGTAALRKECTEGPFWSSVGQEGKS